MYLYILPESPEISQSMEIGNLSHEKRTGLRNQSYPTSLHRHSLVTVRYGYGYQQSEDYRIQALRVLYVDADHYASE